MPRKKGYAEAILILQRQYMELTEQYQWLEERVLALEARKAVGIHVVHADVVYAGMGGRYQ